MTRVDALVALLRTSYRPAADVTLPTHVFDCEPRARALTGRACVGAQVAERDAPGTHPPCAGCADGVALAARLGVLFVTPGGAS